MASEHIASMLDELMGRNRNATGNVRELQWGDQEVCRYYIVNFCPHDLFTNTKADLGPCNKIHDDELRRKFQEEKESYKKSQYLDEFLRFCQRMVTELQARIKKAKERLHLTQSGDETLPPTASGQHKETEEKIQLLTKRMTVLVEEAEKAGCEGNVEQAQGLMKLSDQLKEERDQLRRTIMPFLKEEYSAQQKAMEVCSICGAFLIVGDAQQRIDDHLMGKQHIGYAKLRAAVDQIVEERRKFREERDKEMEEKRKKRDEVVRREADERKRRREEVPSSRRRERSRERGGGRGGGGSHRSRSRDRLRERGNGRRSKSRERRRSRDRSSRHRSPRDRRRSRSPASSSRARSRSRDRKRRRSRSRDRPGGKSRGEEGSRSGNATPSTATANGSGDEVC